MKRKKSKYKKTKDKLDKVFSKFIRKRDEGECYTCGDVKEEKYMQCGHYEPRHYLGTRWDEENCHCQCRSCNIFKQGNYPEYARRLILQYGPEILDILYDRRSSVDKYSTLELEELIDKYK